MPITGQLVLSRVNPLSRWHLSADFALDPAGYVGLEPNPSIRRADGGSNDVAIGTTWSVGVYHLEASLTAQLIPGVVYEWHQFDETISFTFAAIVNPRLLPGPQDDPEAEAFGVDIDWLAEGLDSGGDLPAIRGRQCLLNDLVGRALTVKGEIFHRPTVGASASQRINGPLATGGLSELSGSLKKEWIDDDRVKAASVTAKSLSSGRATVTGKIQTVALPDLNLQVVI